MQLPIILVTNSNFGRISYRFRGIDAFSSKTANFLHPPLRSCQPLRHIRLRISLKPLE